MLYAAVIATGLAVLGSTIGVNLGGLLRARLELLVHVATGALLGITAFDILPEAKAVLSWPVFLVAAASGYALLWIIGRFVFYVCPSCAITHVHESDLARKGSLILLGVALGVHCLLDGMAIATGSELSHRAEIGALLGVALHKVPEGLALGLLLIGARYSRRNALAIATGIEAITIVGALAGTLVAQMPGQTGVGLVFAVVGGSFVYLVFNALGGAFEHSGQVPRVRSLTAELASFLATGLLLWAATRM
ncbi:MAG TPA: ZIP family metal transporter [Fimbriimonadaceae bacterium]|nr:ZIP family metal transporter [Fimbriimonadaceae bacterium]